MPPLRGPGTDPEAEHPEYAGQYRLESRLGSGGMGVVHLSRSTSGMRLAVKVVHEEFAKDPEFRARFRQEVAAARRVSGAFTASVVDADPDAERPWMATLYIPGPTLAEFVKRNGPVSPAQLRYLVAGLAEALRDIHRAGVVHRDLKPSNVLLAADGPKVIDFGISRPSDSDLRTETGKLIGTPPFMAPEQFRRPRAVGSAADVFAMASVLVHAATGRSPFDSDSPYIVAYQVVHDEPQLEGVPADLRPLIERCLAKDPDDRPTPDAMMTELRSISASYDTQTFSAFDIDTEAEGLIPTPRRPPGAEVVIGASGSYSPLRRPEKGRTTASWWRARRLVVAVSTLLAVGTATVWGVQHQGQGDTASARDRGAQSTAGFRPWTTVLRSDERPSDTAACSYAVGALYCSQRGVAAARINPGSGVLQWSVRSPDRETDALSSAPVAAGGVLRVTSKDGNRLSALETSTGRTRWTLDISAYQGAYYSLGTTVLLVSKSADVTAVDGTTGRERWHARLKGESLPVFAEYDGSGMAYAMSGDGKHTTVAAIDLEDGTVRRKHRFDGDLSPIGVSGHHLFLTAADGFSRAAWIVRIDTTDWSERRVRLVVPMVGVQAAIRGDTVFLLEYGGALVAVDTRRRDIEPTAAQQWRVQTSVTEASRPVLAGERVFLTTADGRLLAIDTARGALLGQTEPRPDADSSVTTGAPPSPVVADGKVFATAPDGSVFAVDAKDPSRW
ncbi:serine/threonine-protein kinase [Streptomyces sp. NPDC059718]